MKVKVEMRVSEKLAILQDKEQAGLVIIEIDSKDLTEEEKQELLLMPSRDSDECYRVYDTSYTTGRWGHDIAEANLEELKVLLHEHKAYRAKQFEEFLAKDAENDQKIMHWIDNPNEYLYGLHGKTIRHPHITNIFDPSTNRWKDQSAYLDEIPEFKEAWADAESLDFWVSIDEMIQDMRIKKARQERHKAEEAAKLEAQRKKKEAIAEWVAAKGTPSQKERLAENLLPDEEIITAMRDEIFRPLDAFPRYQKIKASDVCTCDYGDYGEYCDCDFWAADKKEATEEEFRKMKQIRTLMPNAVVTLREHGGNSERCDNEFYRSGILVSVNTGAFQFSREYGVEEVE